MPETPKPDKLPRWSTAGISTEPSEGKKDTGWLSAEKPPFQFFNWILLKSYEFLNWLTERFEKAPGGSVDGTGLTITAFAITPTQGNHTITFGGVSAEIRNISTTNLNDGRLLMLRKDPASTGVLKIATLFGGAGQIKLKTPFHHFLAQQNEYLILRRVGADWEEVSRNGGTSPIPFGEPIGIGTDTVNLIPLVSGVATMVIADANIQKPHFAVEIQNQTGIVDTLNLLNLDVLVPTTPIQKSGIVVVLRSSIVSTLPSGLNVKHNFGGAGRIFLKDGRDCWLSANRGDFLMLMMVGLNWVEIARNFGRELNYGRASGDPLLSLSLRVPRRLIQADSFAITGTPDRVLFDGRRIWISCPTDNTVRFLNINTGVVTSPVGSVSAASGLTFDGINVWAAGSLGISRLAVTTGAPTTAFAAGTSPKGMCFDGTHIWVVNADNNALKIDIATSTIVATVGVGTNPQNCCFDGTHVWVTNQGSNNLTKILASSATVAGTFATGAAPIGIAYDGSHIWVACSGPNDVRKVALDGTAVVTIATGVLPTGVAFDGRYIWVTCLTPNDIRKIDILTNTSVATIALGGGANPKYAAFDGQDLWIANSGANTLRRLPAGI